MTQQPAQRNAGPVRVLVLLAAALGLSIYVLGYLGEVSVTSSFGGPLLVAGGLLAGLATLPRVGRVLAPAAVLTVTGALLLLQMVTGLGGPAVVVVGTVLAFLQTAAVVGALLLDSGAVAGGREPPGVGPGPYGPAAYLPPAVGTYGGTAPAAIGYDPGGPRHAAGDADAPLPPKAPDPP